MIITQSELMGGFLDHAFEDSTPGSHVFLICEDGSEHRGEISLRRSGFEIRDCIRWFHDRSHLSVVVGRKPIEGTVAETVLKYGTGGLNVDAGRIPSAGDDILRWCGSFALGRMNDDGWIPKKILGGSTKGRWPANVIHDGGLITDLFPITIGGGVPKTTKRLKSPVQMAGPERFSYTPYADTLEGGGSASRFFSTAESLDDLIAYLKKLIQVSDETS